MAFVVGQAAAIAVPALHLPGWTLTFVVVVLLLGFPVALVLAWAFELTPEGVVRTPHQSEGGIAEAGGGARRSMRLPAVAGVLVAVGIVGAVALQLYGPGSGDPHPPADFGGHSIAVLPFANLSPDAGDEYLSDGITEELIAALGRIQGIQVASRSASFALKGTGAQAREVGTRLGVTHVLEGSLRPGPERLRVHAMLVDAGSGYQLWSEAYDRPAGDLFGVQEEIARAIVSSLHLQLAGEAGTPEARLVQRPTASAEAYDHYLKGRYFWDRSDHPGNWERAVEHFSEAVALDPEFALAYVGLADAHSDPWWSPPAEVWNRGRAFAERAVALAPELAQAHNALAYVRFKFDWDWEGAEAGFQRALELDPDDVVVLASYGSLLTALGRLDEAVALHRRAQERDPVTAWLSCPGLAWPLLIQAQRQGRRPLEAEAECRAALTLDPTSPWVHQMLATILRSDGRALEALELQERSVELGGPEWRPGLAFARAVAGDRDGARTTLDALQREAAEGYVPPMAFATIHLGLGEVSETLDWLERAHAERSPDMVWLGVSPRWGQLRDEPRFQALLSSLALE